MTWVDSEVHLLPPEWCREDFVPPPSESAIRRLFYEHSEAKIALPRASVEPLLSEMDRSGIRQAIIMGLPWMSAELCWRNNAYIAEVIQRFPEHFVGLAVLPPPRSDQVADDVRRAVEEYGLQGIKVVPSWQGYRLDDSVFEPAIETMIEHNMILMPHTDHLFIDPQQADTAYRLFVIGQRFPELKIMAPHLGGLLCLYNLHEPIRPVMKNMLFITSVPSTMTMVRFAVTAVGADRLAFGTDFPFNPSHDQRTVRDAFEKLSLSDDELRLVAGENVLRFLGISS